MKTNKKFQLINLSILIIILLVGCKAKKDVIVEQDQNKNNIVATNEISLPFASSEYYSDDSYFRSTQSGTSTDMATAKKIAMQNAKTEIAGSIEALVKAVSDNYINQRNINDKMEFEAKFDELSRIVINQKLNDVRLKGEKALSDASGKITYWVAIEIPREPIQKDIADRLSNDEKTKLDFDKFQYEKIFNEEMGKFIKANQ